MQSTAEVPIKQELKTPDSAENFEIKEEFRTPAECIESIDRQCDHLLKWYNQLLEWYKLNPSVATPSEEFGILCWVLHGHALRLQRSIDDLFKLDDLRQLKNNIIALQLVQKKLNDGLAQINQHLPQPKELKAETTIAVGGAGPMGYFVSIVLLRYASWHKSNIVLVSDAHADFQTRNGIVNDSAFQFYINSITVVSMRGKLNSVFNARLKDCVLFRDQSYCIKHLEYAGQAVYRSMGGNIIHGKVNLKNVKKIPHAKFPVMWTERTFPWTKETFITNVLCFIHTMGSQAELPAELIPDSKAPINKLLRSHCVFLNVKISRELADKLRLLTSKKGKANYSFYLFPSHNLNNSNQEINSHRKVQIYTMLTKQEYAALKWVIKLRFQTYLNSIVDETNKKDAERIIIMLLFAEYFGIQRNVKIDIMKEVHHLTLRHTIKQGKKRTTEFDLSQPPSPIQGAVSLQDTSAIIFCLGHSAAPFTLTGTSLKYYISHASQVLQHMFQTGFKPGLFTTHPEITKHFNTLVEKADKFTKSSNLAVSDMSIQMGDYFAKKWQFYTGMPCLFGMPASTIKSDMDVERNEEEKYNLLASAEKYKSNHLTHG